MLAVGRLLLANGGDIDIAVDNDVDLGVLARVVAVALVMLRLLCLLRSLRLFRLCFFL